MCDCGATVECPCGQDGPHSCNGTGYGIGTPSPSARPGRTVHIVTTEGGTTK